ATQTRLPTKQAPTPILKLPIQLYHTPSINSYHQQIKHKPPKLHPPISFTILRHYLPLHIQTIIHYYLYHNLSTLTQNALRAIP
ncbi:urease accessory UreF family protein, partial [Staphylococcus hominis]|uniref:urease accessory UreF family protein n=1 Tax=Staphylococcus hominis TaxID=1290 RepID=UPI0037097C6F